MTEEAKALVTCAVFTLSIHTLAMTTKINLGIIKAFQNWNWFSDSQIYYVPALLSIIFIVLVQVGPVRSLRTATSSIIVNVLQECQDYWVTVSAVNCGFTVKSAPTYISVYSPAQFSATIHTNAGMSCNAWINTNTNQKLADLQTFIIGVLRDCGYYDTCRAASNFSCQAVINEVTVRCEDQLSSLTA